MRPILMAMPLLACSLGVVQASSNRETLPPDLSYSGYTPYSGGVSASDNTNSILTQTQWPPYNRRLSIK
jgi:hypothetical protein